MPQVHDGNTDINTSPSCYLSLMGFWWDLGMIVDLALKAQTGLF